MRVKIEASARHKAAHAINQIKDKGIVPLLESGSRSDIEAWTKENIKTVSDARNVITEMLIIMLHLYHK